MQRRGTEQASQLEDFALFLEDHHGFSPALRARMRSFVASAWVDAFSRSPRWKGSS